MLWLYLVFLTELVFARCVWHSPVDIFPEELVHMRFDNRFALKSVHGNHLRSFSGGLDDNGHTSFDLIFSKSHALKDIHYTYVSAEPSDLWQRVNLDSGSNDVVLKTFTHLAPESLAYRDTIKVWISARSPCLPQREIARVAYDFNVTATYELYHCYDNTLNKNATKAWSERGWVSDASIIMHPTLKYATSIFRHYVQSPCGEAWLDSSLKSVNTSQYSYWDLEKGWWVSNRWVGHENYSIPRCHRREHGNVCSIIATVRLTYRDCYVPISFSVSQSVSQMARLTRRSYTTPHRPASFDASRRMPEPDHGDMRYDMCEARACEDDSVCRPLHIENQGLMSDGNISISQHDFFHNENQPEDQVGPHFRNGYIETQCRFEVIGFMDNIWSPHIYFRQWIGYNYTLL